MAFIPKRQVYAVTILLGLFAAELMLSVRDESQTIDEAVHISSGYSYWTRSDFGMNPENPPLVKLVATAPLLSLRLRVPPIPEGPFKEVEYAYGREFFIDNGPDKILFRSRAAASSFALVLALFLFLAADEMFDAGAAFFALLLLIFEPTVLAHGALVTTDMGVTCCLFLAVYSFYRYVKHPSAFRLLQVGVAAGLALGAKVSGILIFPTLFLVALTEVIPRMANRDDSGNPADSRPTREITALHMAASLAIICAIALTLLWSLYGFRFQARPAGLTLTPALSDVAGPQRHPAESRIVLAVARYKLLPESYIYGLVDVSRRAHSAPSFVFDRVYPTGHWFYFPVVLFIKSTLASLFLFALLWVAPALRARTVRREVTFLVIPFALHTLVAMASGLNLGVRHMLPAYPFVIILIGYAAWSLVRINRRWAYVVVPVLIFHVVSSVRTFPNYLSYSNELFGGPEGTYKVLTESNVDWGQGLKSLKAYIDRNHIKNCWLVYYGWVAADPSGYGVPCRMLPGDVQGISQPTTGPIPASIRGPLFVSATQTSGILSNGDQDNPYASFKTIRPMAVIGGSILAFDGEFDMSAVVAKFKDENSSEKQADHYSGR